MKDVSPLLSKSFKSIRVLKKFFMSHTYVVTTYEKWIGHIFKERL